MKIEKELRANTDCASCGKKQDNKTVFVIDKNNKVKCPKCFKAERDE